MARSRSRFGIGIAHGLATLGTIGFEGRFDYAAIGTVSNVASRLCDEAKPGQILISPRVLMAVEQVVKVEAAGESEGHPTSFGGVQCRRRRAVAPTPRSIPPVVDDPRRRLPLTSAHFHSPSRPRSRITVAAYH